MFIAGTQIVTGTANGRAVKAIEEVCVGDIANTFCKRGPITYPVVRTHSTTLDRTLFKLSVEGVTHDIVATDDHEFFVVLGEQVLDIEWRALRNLNVGDRLIISTPTHKRSNATLPVFSGPDALIEALRPFAMSARLGNQDCLFSRILAKDPFPARDGEIVYAIEVEENRPYLVGCGSSLFDCGLLAR